jgi:hypothetical protein
MTAVEDDGRAGVRRHWTLRTRIKRCPRGSPELAAKRNRRMAGAADERGRTIVRAEQEGPEQQPLAAWAVAEAAGEMCDLEDPYALVSRARQLMLEADVRDHERHDEDDDPDQGGEG